MKYRASDNALCKKLYVSWPFIISSRGEERGGGREEGTRNSCTAEHRVEILKCEVAMKRARNILSQRMPLNEVNLF